MNKIIKANFEIVRKEVTKKEAIKLMKEAGEPYKVELIEGIADDEAIVFLVDTDDAGNSIIRIEEDEEVAIAVFDKYYDLLEEAQNEEKAQKKAAPKAKAPAKK